MRAFLFAIVFFSCVILADLEVRLLRILHRGAELGEIPRRRHIGMAGTLLRLARIMTGLRLVVEPSAESPLPCRVLIIGNHQSMLGIAFLVHALPQHDIRFVAGEAALLRLAALPGVSPVVFAEGGSQWTGGTCCAASCG